MIPKFNNILELVQRFPDEKSCHQYISAQRWNGYMTCPHNGCSGDEAYVFSDGIRYKCKTCKRIYTAKTGSIFESSNLPLIKWLLAMYLIMHKKGISSVQLSKDIGVTQKTAWFLLHRIRTTLNINQSDEISGTIQVDETFVGGKNKNRHADKRVKYSQGRSFKDKVPVVGMLRQQIYELEDRQHKILSGVLVTDKTIIQQSLVICKVVKDTKARSIQPVLLHHVVQGSTIISDEWRGYNGINALYNHYVVDHTRKQYVSDSGHTTNAIEGFWTTAKRSIIGIYHKTSRKHLQKYFDEFAFRYNYRNLGANQQMNVILTNVTQRLKYKELVA